MSGDYSRTEKRTSLLSLLEDWRLYSFLYITVCRPNSR